MSKKLVHYHRITPLPILLFVCGIVMLPFSSNISPAWKSVLVDLLVHLVFIIFSIVVLTWRIRKYPTRILAIGHATLLAIILALVIFILSDVLISKLILQDKDYLDHIDNTELLRFTITLLCLGWFAHICVSHKHQEETQKQSALHQHAIISLKEAELFRLRQQLQPHFLYNSLNSINALIQLDPENAQEMVGRLSDFLRLSVKRDTTEHILIKDELDYIETYLSIESVRFGNRLQIEINKEGQDWENAKIPAFILQPIIENAIKFGLYGNTGAVAIRIAIAIHNTLLQIRIENPFDTSTQPPRGTGFGLEGVSRRLTLLYGRADLLETKKTENIFTTIIKIPQ